MAISNSYVSLPEGNHGQSWDSHRPPWNPGNPVTAPAEATLGAGAAWHSPRETATAADPQMFLRGDSMVTMELWQ